MLFAGFYYYVAGVHFEDRAMSRSAARGVARSSCS
jgi:hypothetical protein